MIGLGFLLAFCAYIVIAVTLTVWVPRQLFDTPRARTIAAIVILLTFVLIPTWDIIPGKFYFEHLCKTEGGLKIYKTVDGVEGFLAQDPSIVRDALQKNRFQFVETHAVSDGFIHYSLDDAGQLKSKNIARPSARYAQQLETSKRTASVQSFTEAIVDTLTKERLATRSQFAYAGNWLQRMVSPFLGGGEFCSNVPVRTLFVETLKPAIKN